MRGPKKSYRGRWKRPQTDKMACKTSVGDKSRMRAMETGAWGRCADAKAAQSEGKRTRSRGGWRGVQAYRRPIFLSSGGETKRIGRESQDLDQNEGKMITSVIAGPGYHWQ